MTQQRKYLRRTEAAQFLQQVYGFSSDKTLATLASRGDGPVYRKRMQICLYLVEDLISWAEARIGNPRVSPRDPVDSVAEKPTGAPSPQDILDCKRPASAAAEASP